MNTATQIQLSETELERLEAGELVKISANWKEFMDFLEETPHKAEFNNNEITIMGLALFMHEWLVVNIAFVLKTIYLGQPNVFVLGSNLGVARPDTSYFNPDVTVVKGKPSYYRNSKAIVTNPFLVVEILSQATVGYDWQTKLPRYERIESLQQVLFVDPFEQIISSFVRTNDPKTWIHTIYDQPQDAVVIDGNTALLKTFFDGMPEA